MAVEKKKKFKLFLIGVGYRGSNVGTLVGKMRKMPTFKSRVGKIKMSLIIGGYYPLFYLFLNNKPNKVSHIADLKLLVKQQK